MTYGDLLTLLPTLVNRSSAGLTEKVDLVRRAVKWAYASALSSNDFEVFSTHADVDVDVVAGLSWMSFTDINAEVHAFSRVSNVSLWNSETQAFDPFELITKKHKRYRDLLRRPMTRTTTTDAHPSSFPIAYLKSTKLFVSWFNEHEWPAEIRLRVEGLVAFPDFLDTNVLNEAQLDARDWMLINAENYLITKSIEFLQLYMKEDERIADMAQMSDREYANALRLDSAIKDSNDDGYNLD